MSESNSSAKKLKKAVLKAQKASLKAQKEWDEVKAALDECLADDESEPKSKDQIFSLPDEDDDDKENCASASPNLNQGQGLPPTFDKIETAATSDKAKSPSGFVRALKAMNPLKEGAGKDQGEVVQLGEEVNNEEVIALKTKAKFSVFDGEFCQWTGLRGEKKFKSQTGTLKLYRNKATGKTRLVHRNIVGTVKLNVSVGKEMICLEKIRVQVERKGKVFIKTFIQFIAVACEDTGPECFRIQVVGKNNLSVLDQLYTQLKEMGADVKEPVHLD